MRPFDWQELVKIAEAVGCRYDRTKGDHYVMVRDGMARPVIIPKKPDLKEDIVLGIGRTLGLNKKEILALADGTQQKALSKKSKNK